MKRFGKLFFDLASQFQFFTEILILLSVIRIVFTEAWIFFSSPLALISDALLKINVILR